MFKKIFDEEKVKNYIYENLKFIKHENAIEDEYSNWYKRANLL